MDLADYFLDVDTILGITFQITIHNRQKQAKVIGETLPESRCRGKAKEVMLRNGDSVQGASTAEILEKKQGELEERRKRKRDETVCLTLALLLVLTPTID